MRTKHLCVLFHIRIKGELVLLNMFKPSSVILLTVPRHRFFCGSFDIYVSCLSWLCCLVC